MKNRFEIVKNSKFETLTHGELESVKGGLCISCKKRKRKVPINLSVLPSSEIRIDPSHGGRK